MRERISWLLALILVTAGVSLRPALADDPRDVFDAIGSLSLCPTDVPVLAFVDLDPDVNGPGGPGETALELTADSGRASLMLDNFVTGDFLLSANRMALGSCAAGDRSRVILRFVDANAPGFDEADPATWTYTRAQWITLEASESADVGSGQFLLSAYRELNQTQLVATCPSSVSCELADAVGIAEIRMSGSPSDATDNVLDDMVVRFVEPAFTATGSNVQVISGDVTVTYPSVSSDGYTGVAHSQANPAADPPPATLFGCDPPVFYGVERTAATSSNPEVCVSYSSTCNETGISLYQYRAGICGFQGCTPSTWTDVTTSVNTATNVICGTASLSTGSFGPTVEFPFTVLADDAPCSPESCDGLDNDCDGQVDEDFPVGDACSAGAGQCQRVGSLVCTADGTGVACDAIPGAPSAETCNALDDDCDGLVDESFPLGDPCSVGVGQCQRGGSLVCTADGSGVQCSASPGAPVAEMCNGLDDDCDGQVDEGDPDGGGACSTGLPGICDAGVTSCSGGGLVCSQTGFPSAEVCNGLDDDCNGAVDDDAVGAPLWFPDTDGDGFGDPLGIPVSACAQPAGFVGNTDDCNDADPAVGASCNTPPTNDPVVLPDDSDQVRVVLPNVTVGGDTTITTTTCGDASGFPEGIAIDASAICVDVDTSAEFQGDAIVCIDYDPAQFNPSDISMVRCALPPDPPPPCNRPPEEQHLCPPCALLDENRCDQPGEANCTDDPQPGVFCAFTSGFSIFAVGPPLDGDGDFAPDLLDNCPADFNFFQDDGDADGAGDVCDTCPVWPDADQADADGNGTGDACECGDQTGDGLVNVSDILAINEVIFEIQPAGALCDTDEDGACNISDILGVNAKIFGAPAFCSRSPSGP